MLRSALPAFLCLFALSGSALSANLERKVEYFFVKGANLAEIHADLQRRGPQIGGQGPRHPGATRMEFTTRLGYRQADGRCAISAVTVTLKATMILPRLRQRGRLHEAVGRVWDALAADIRRHEEEHVAIAHAHATEMESAVKRLGRFRDCAAAEAAARKSSDRILARHDRAQARFDRNEAKGFERRISRLIDAR